jgi:hypothetical protein
VLHYFLVVMLAVNITRGPVDPSTAIDGTCYGSNFYLATGNVPFGDSSKATTVVNQWAVLVPSGQALAWIAKTESGRYWVQINGDMKDSIRAAFPAKEAVWLLDGVTATSHVSYARPMTALSEFNRNFAAIHGVLHPCFTKDLTLSY